MLIHIKRDFYTFNLKLITTESDALTAGFIAEKLMNKNEFLGI